MNGRSQPNPITWFFWALAPAIVLFALLSKGSTGPVLWITFVLSLGPAIVFLLSLYKSPWRAHFTPTTIVCAVLAVIGVVLWQITNNPLHAIIFSILVDLFASVPTLEKAYRRPRSEYPMPYAISALSMLITLFTIQGATIDYLFPLYMLLINCLLFAVPYFRKRTYHARFDHRNTQAPMRQRKKGNPISPATYSDL